MSVESWMVRTANHQSWDEYALEPIKNNCNSQKIKREIGFPYEKGKEELKRREKGSMKQSSEFQATEVYLLKGLNDQRIFMKQGC